MSTFAVTAEQLTIHDHPNADALELAQVGLYRAVVAKGAYKTGDWALYIPEQAIMPDSLIDELGLTGRLAGKESNRVRAVRLRGEVSQGIVCKPAAIAEWFGPGGVFDGDDLETRSGAGTDFAELLGIVKWVPEVPAHMAGVMVEAPDLMRWVDIENIKRYPDIFESGEMVVASEKVHGTCCLTTVTADGQTLVTSKGFSAKGLAIAESESNLYWRAVKAHRVAEVAAKVLTVLGANRVGIFGEVYGRGVQDLGYNVNAGVTPGYAVFDISVDVPGVGVIWLNQELVLEMAGGLQVVPTLYRGPYDEATLLDVAEGQTVIGAGAHIREGIVVRPVVERRSEVLGGRAIAKFVSEKYLMRKGETTEFE
jgi:RNA ligase (TIGR02306 family)